MLRITLNQNDGGQRLDKFLQKALKGLPPALMYKYIRKKRIKVNGKRAKENQILCAGDCIELYIPDAFSKNEGDLAELERICTMPRILYEDKNILICDKPAGVLSHTGDKNEQKAGTIPERETLIFILQAYLYRRGEYNPKEETSFAPALCNRIDRNTGGIVIAAKNAAALREMNRLIREGCLDKRYLCAVHGRPAPAQAVLEGYLFKNAKTKTVSVASSPTPGAKRIVTGYRTLSYNREHNLSLLEIRLETGRTHQIRAHMAWAGYPLLGEGKYGQNTQDRALGYAHQALYAYRIAFTVPDGPLAYLNGQTFSVDSENIRFLKLFSWREQP